MKRAFIFPCTAVFMAASPAAAMAQNPAQQAPQPCMTSAVHAEFDFWVGTWNVYGNTADGPYAGQNVITKTSNGCLIEEDWTNAAGATGHSMNFYDPMAEAWRQVWVSNGVVIDYTGGLNADGAMALDGEIFYLAQGNRAPFRGVWTPNEDGTVTQHFEQQDAAGEWQAWFTGVYVRVEDDPRAQEAAAARGE